MTRRYGYNPTSYKFEMGQRLYHARRGNDGEAIPRGKGFEGVVTARSKTYGSTTITNYTLTNDDGKSTLFGESVLEAVDVSQP